MLFHLFFISKETKQGKETRKTAPDPSNKMKDAPEGSINEMTEEVGHHHPCFFLFSLSATCVLPCIVDLGRDVKIIVMQYIL